MRQYQVDQYTHYRTPRSKGRKKGAQSLFGETMIKTSQIWKKEMDVKIQHAE